MKEYGSDFHRCDHDFRGPSDFCDVLGSTRWYACGRHAIEALIRQEGWKRIWIPAYFCYEVIGHIKGTGIEVVLYDDCPIRMDDDEVVRGLPYQEGDVLLRMNYFGVRKKRTNEGIVVPVIEDHTHGLITDWALESDADWCVASLRKSLPVAAGGVLWSPKGKQLPDAVGETDDCRQMAKIRYEAMTMKAEYLRYGGDKEAFRERYLDSEERIDRLSLSGIDAESMEITRALNVKQWTDLKRDNWLVAKGLFDKRFKVLGSEREDYWQPFSLVILMESAEERESLRRYMIQHCLYPAILWRMPEDSPFAEVKDFADRMLSVHCDIRYSRNDIAEICKIINGYFDTDI